MCMIIVKPKGINFPPKEHLLKSEKRNIDGIGIAYTQDNKVIIKKDFKNAKECYAWMETNLKIEQAVIIHQRLGTAGLMDKGTRHPFPMTIDCEKMRKENQECKIAFAHNGVFLGHGTDKKYSDSMLILKKFFGSLGNLVFNNEGVRELILEFVGSSNKIVFLKHTGKIAIFGSNWIEHRNECLYSNKNYEFEPITEKYYGNNINYKNYSPQNKKKKGKQEGLPYCGRPPMGQPKKKYQCDKCKAGKKSKWRGDLEMYVCSKCYKAVHKEATKDVPAVQDNGGLRCFYCGKKDAMYRFDIKQMTCDKCYKNDLWFRDKLKNFNDKAMDISNINQGEYYND